jgi:hypothetical protein
MDELVKVALVGTAKHPQGGRAASAMSDELLTAWQGESAEGLLLLQAGIEAMHAQAGIEPTALTAAVDPAPPETAPAGSPRLLGILQNALASDSNELLTEFAALMRSSGLLAPPELLPAMLDIQEPSLREAVLPVLGERGRWLSQFREAWNWATVGVSAMSAGDVASLKRQWEEGNIATRCTVLGRLRRMDVAQARTWLQEVFKQEKPEHRVRLLEQFSSSLDASDETFLEETLTDRSENVRRTAADLLSRLPGSQLAARMLERADAILQGEPSKPPAITCTPPTEIDAAWKRDGVPDQVPSGRGKRSVWVETVLRAVPPDHWVKRFAAEPSVLIETIAADDFGPAVIEGWTAATIVFAAEAETAGWLVPLWNHWLPLATKGGGAKAGLAKSHVVALFRAMPAAEAEACLTAEFSAGDETQILVTDLAASLPRPWSAAFATRFLKQSIGMLDRKTDNAAYRWICSLAPAAKALPPSCFSAALKMAEHALEGPKSGHYTERELDKFVEIIRLRESFYQEVS